MQCPYLAAVPAQHHDLIVKATISGILVLKQNRFKQRYTGNKYSAVDINGNLWVKASDLKKEMAAQGEQKPKKKKKARVETQADTNNFTMQTQMSENLSTSESPLLTVPNTLSTIPKGKRYKIKKREVRQRLLGFINTQAGKKELYFWTVTFPQGTPDAVAYRMYNIWLTSLRQYKMLRGYLWVAERQENGTVHFHIAIPHRMSVGRANGMMRTTLKTFAKRGEIPGYSALRTRNYNGVDIAKNRKTKRVTNFAIKKGTRSLISYLTKYVTKNNTEFTHLAWHNSREFSSIFTGVTFTVPEFVKYGWHMIINRAKLFANEYFTFVPWLNDPPAMLTEHLFKVNSFLQSILNNH